MKYISVFLLILITCRAYSDDESHAMNVLLIIADDMNGYGFYDEYSIAQTPHLDSFAIKATVFSRAYCASPVCTPSRAATFSGIGPVHSGAYQNGSDPWRKSEVLKQAETLPELFKRHGYTTFGRGKIYHSKLEEERSKNQWDNDFWGGGFGPFPDSLHQLKGKFWGVQQFPDSIFPDVINMNSTKEFLSKKHKKPFFAVYGLWRPHSPFTAPKRFVDEYQDLIFEKPLGYKENDLEDLDSEALKLLDPFGRFSVSGINTMADWETMMKGYCATTSFADNCIGQVLESLEFSGNAENTVVIFLSDNGYFCGEKNHWEKGVLWEQACRVPFAIFHPQCNSKRTINSCVSLMDIYPTLVEICDLTPPNHDLDGISLMPQLLGNENSERIVLTSIGKNFSSLRSGKYRYICYPDGSEELYDHSSDPYEWENLANRSEMRSVLATFQKHIPEQWADELKGRRY